MTTVFDVITVSCFAALVLAFFRFTDREIRTLLYFLLAAVIFAIANQAGNSGSAILASMLILAGIAWATLAARR